jgi:hypothetical protein
MFHKDLPVPFNPFHDIMLAVVMSHEGDTFSFCLSHKSILLIKDTVSYKRLQEEMGQA